MSEAQDRAREAAARAVVGEIEEGTVGPQTFGLRGMAERIDRVGDVWEGMYEHRQSISTAMQQLKKLFSPV